MCYDFSFCHKLNHCPFVVLSSISYFCHIDTKIIVCSLLFGSDLNNTQIKIKSPLPKIVDKHLSYSYRSSTFFFLSNTYL